MKAALDWLKKYVEIEQSGEELAHMLTMAGIAVDRVDHSEGACVLELDLTPNRGDCLGIINVAREIAALTGNKITLPLPDPRPNAENIEDHMTLRIADPDLCRRYSARLIKNIKIAPSPDWMQKALTLSGIRPINNVVDITNYVMLETNQPLHAFDYRLLGSEPEILVRRALAGETIVTLDGNKHELTADMLVITDGIKPIALAGIMGGENTEINWDTETVLLESANFNRINIRRTSRKLNLRTDSSQRFEKGVDVNGSVYAVDRAAALMRELAQGEVVGQVLDLYPDPLELNPIKLRSARVNEVLGTQLTGDAIKYFLQCLEFEPEQDGEDFWLKPVSYRPDIIDEEDFIEEIARLYGYDRIPAELPSGNTTSGGFTANQNFIHMVRKVLSTYLYEVINLSFDNPQYFAYLNLPEDDVLRQAVPIANPLSEEISLMRTSLLPGLLQNINRNQAHKNTNLAFFEIGNVFRPSNNQLPDETLKLGMAIAGSTDTNWGQPKTELDFYYLKGIIEILFQTAGIKNYSFTPATDSRFHPGRSALVVSGGNLLGAVGEIHPQAAKNLDLKGRVVAGELNLQMMFDLVEVITMSKNIPKYPGIERDLAIVLPQSVNYSQVLHVITGLEIEFLQMVKVVDVYVGEQIPADCISMALRFYFQSYQRTLKDEEVNLHMDRIMECLNQELQAQLRK